MTARVLLIVMVAVLQSRTAINCCPSECECEQLLGNDVQDDDEFYAKVSCSDLKNGSILLPDNTKELVLSGIGQNELDTFIENLISNLGRLPYLSSLIFRRNHVADFVNITFSGLDRLRSLDFSQNKIERIESEGVFNFTDLETLDLSRNKIGVINNAAFRTLDSLQMLNLSANNLVNISSDVFVGLHALKCLDLSLNDLAHIGDDVLVPLGNLLYLNLSNNQLEVLDETCFNGLLRLQQLDVSWNKLARVAPGSLHLPSLARLLLEGNPMLGGSRKLPLLMGTGRRLQTVDASRTGLEQVPAALTHSIRTLRLAGNSIRSVNRGDLDCYPLLQLLDFTSNLLEEIEDDALGRLDSLTVLYLTSNRMKSIPKSLPERLRVLHLENNEVQKIRNGDFFGLELLEVLLLHDNKITIVEESAFSRLESLATLDLSRNPISNLDAGFLSGPGQLQVLRLCGLVGVNSPAKDVMFPLSAPEHLITLDLSHSPGLARQLLADDAALAAARELQELNLAGAGLEHIRSDLMHFLSQLRLLHVDDNPLNCTSMQWLALWMRRQDVPEYRRVVCSNPPELWGTPLIDLQDADYQDAKPIREKTAEGKNTNSTQTAPNEVSADPFRNATPAGKNDEVSTETATSISQLASLLFYTTASTESTTKQSTSEPNTSNRPSKGSSAPFNQTVEFEQIINATADSLLNTPSSYYAKNENNSRKLSNGPEGEHFHNKQSDSSAANYDKLSKLVPEEVRSDEMALPEAITDANKYATADIITSTMITSLAGTGEEHTENVPGSAKGEMSMFSLNERSETGYKLLHPGMLILAVGLLGTAASLAMLTSRFTRRRKRRLQEEDAIEVSSIPNVTELW